jgi:antirestriction protein
MPRFYAACLASYNAGILHGRWIDATSDADEMALEVAAMLKESPVPLAEEWAMHDMEDLPRVFGEYAGLKAVAAFMELVDEHDHIEPEDIAKIVDDFGDVSTAEDALRGRFVGIYDAFRDYADEAADEMLTTRDNDDPLSRYFDYESFARDLAMDMHTVDVSAGVAVFHA